MLFVDGNAKELVPLSTWQVYPKPTRTYNLEIDVIHLKLAIFNCGRYCRGRVSFNDTYLTSHRALELITSVRLVGQICRRQEKREQDFGRYK
jgi:hypothetical protein